MIGDTRVKWAAAILVAVLSVLGSAQAHAATGPAVRYACDAHQNLVVERFATRAVVQFVDRTYVLRRKPSSIGEKYLAPTAPLSVDGASVVFVAENRLQLGQSVEARLTASR